MTKKKTLNLFIVPSVSLASLLRLERLALADVKPSSGANIETFLHSQ